MISLDFLGFHAFWAIPFALLPAALHWWWTRSAVRPSASAVLPERLLVISQRVSFVTILCMLAIAALAGWKALWILPLQFVAMTATTYRARRALFAETWSFGSYLSWRVRLHVGMFGLWWLIALAPAAVAEVHGQAQWWLAGLALVIALAWHHWSGRVLLVLLGASRLDRPELDAHFQRVFSAARVPTPPLWRAGAAGSVLANAFAMVTLGQRGVLFFDSLLEQLSADEITAILAHEVAHLEQFTRRRLLGLYLVTSVLIVLLMMGSAIVSALIPGFESWLWLVSFIGVFGGILLRARRMQAHETGADLRAVELCGNPGALIRGLTRIYEINHIPRRWSRQLEERATHPSLARRIQAIRGQAATPQTAQVSMERVVVASSESGRCVTIDPTRIAFLWIDGDIGDSATVLDRANRVEMVTYDQLSELRLATNRGSIALMAVDRDRHRWSMPIREIDAERVQAALDLVDHQVVASSPARDFAVARRAAVLLVVLLAAPYNAIGAVIGPALLAMRRPKRPIMLALAAALAGTALASINELNVSIVRIALLSILALTVLWSVRRPPQPDAGQPVMWLSVEWVALLIPVALGLIIAAASARDLFGLHAAVRDRAWFTAALATVAVFCFVHTGQRSTRRVGLSVAVLATISLVVGSPWFLLHAVADPLVTVMPFFNERVVPAVTLARRDVVGEFSSVRLTADGKHFLLFGEDSVIAETEDDDAALPQPHRFIIGGFDRWSREIRAFDVAAIDDQRLLVLNRDRSSSHLHAEDLRTGEVLWTTTVPDVAVATVQASPDGRWRALARLGNAFERIDGQVGSAQVRSTRWTITSDAHSYIDMPRVDDGSIALGIAPQWEEPSLSWLLSDFRETTRLLRVDPSGTSELATSHLSVECPAPPMDVAGFVCISLDGRSSRLWRVDAARGGLTPIGETARLIWKPSQLSNQQLVGIASGRPVIISLDSQTVVTLTRDQSCWTQDVAVARDVMIAICNPGGATTVTQFQLPAGVH
jgi:heat shock protein HtpX